MYSTSTSISAGTEFQIVTRSSAMRRAQCDGSAERPFGKSVVTQTSIAVNEVLHGRFDPPVVHLSQLGGTATEQDTRFVQRTYGYVRFEVGERVIVFIEMAEPGAPGRRGARPGQVHRHL